MVHPTFGALGAYLGLSLAHQSVCLCLSFVAVYTALLPSHDTILRFQAAGQLSARVVVSPGVESQRGCLNVLLLLRPLLMDSLKRAPPGHSGR